MLQSSEIRQPTFIDVFAGCGGLSLGLMQSGWKGLFAVERETNAFETLEHNLINSTQNFTYTWPEWLPKTPHDIIELLDTHQERLRALSHKVDMLVGGPPCQGFSTAGRRDPNDPRNRLVEGYLKLVDILQPKVVLIENVRGITLDFEDQNEPTGKRNYAQWIISALAAKYTVSSQMLDTSDFGVPQKRHRFFIIAIRRGWVPLGDGNPFESIDRIRHRFIKEKGLASVPVSSRAAISDLEVGRNGTVDSRTSGGFQEIGYRQPLTSYQRLMHRDSNVKPSDTRLARHKPEIRSRFEKLIEICRADGRLNVSLSQELRAKFGLSKCAIRVLDPETSAPTITSMPDDLLHYAEPRTLTVRENARLQSFPDWFEFKGKYTSGGLRRRYEVPRFTQVANAVPPLAAEAIGLAIKSYCFGDGHVTCGLVTDAGLQTSPDFSEVAA